MRYWAVLTLVGVNWILSTSAAYNYNYINYTGNGEPVRRYYPQQAYYSQGESISPDTRIYRRSQSRDLYSERPQWLNHVRQSEGLQQMTIPQKPRRTHYGQTQTQTGSTLTRFFDSNGSSNRWSNRRWNSGSQATATQRDGNGRVKMGVANSMCDDAKTNLTVDWDMSPINHTCYHPNTRFPLDPTLPSLLQCDRLPPRYVPGHVCMTEKIPYSEDVPTHGDHRPLWPMFGEYIFVPRERWLHNIEHGAVVMLYHPCAHPAEVSRLKNIVKSCVGKHIITPSTLLSPERPLALVAWSCRLLMSGVDEQAAKSFIERRAMKGPEGTYTKEGQYTFGLLQKATMSGNGAKYGYSRVQCV